MSRMSSPVSTALSPAAGSSRSRTAGAGAERDGEAEEPLLAAREVAGEDVRLGAEADEVEDGAGARGQLALVAPGRGGRRDHLPERRPGEAMARGQDIVEGRRFREDAGPLEHAHEPPLGDAIRRQPRDRRAVELDPAARPAAGTP